MNILKLKRNKKPLTPTRNESQGSSPQINLLMKTPVEKLFELLWDTPKDKLTWYAIRSLMVKKEMAEIIEAFHTGMEMQRLDPNSGIAEEYYSLRFKTKEK